MTERVSSVLQPSQVATEGVSCVLQPSQGVVDHDRRRIMCLATVTRGSVRQKETSAPLPTPLSSTSAFAAPSDQETTQGPDLCSVLFPTTEAKQRTFLPGCHDSCISFTNPDRRRVRPQTHRRRGTVRPSASDLTRSSSG
jgi:hypothetical protein